MTSTANLRGLLSAYRALREAGQLNPDPAQLLAAEKLQALKPETIIESGPASDIILGVVQKQKAELIVMGAHRSWAHSMAGHLPWATAAAILCEAPCPVLTVRD